MSNYVEEVIRLISLSLQEKMTRKQEGNARQENVKHSGPKSDVTCEGYVTHLNVLHR